MNSAGLATQLASIRCPLHPQAVGPGWRGIVSFREEDCKNLHHGARFDIGQRASLDRRFASNCFDLQRIRASAAPSRGHQFHRHFLPRKVGDTCLPVEKLYFRAPAPLLQNVRVPFSDEAQRFRQPSGDFNAGGQLLASRFDAEDVPSCEHQPQLGQHKAALRDNRL